MAEHKYTWKEKLLVTVGVTSLASLASVFIISLFSSYQSAKCKENYQEFLHFQKRVEKVITVDSMLLDKEGVRTSKD